MGGHEISIKSIFDFRTSLPINEILYETKFEIYCNDKTESHHITENKLKVAINTITWEWAKSLIIIITIYFKFGFILINLIGTYRSHLLPNKQDQY
jgi:hypothetical protein